MKEFSVFVLDDDVAFCKLLNVLVKHNIFVSKFPDCNVMLETWTDMRKLENAVIRMEEVKPDLVILDYMLGLTADACLNSLKLLKKIVLHCSDILIISGLHANDPRLGVIKDTLHDMNIRFLSKPFGVDELAAVIRESIWNKENG